MKTWMVVALFVAVMSLVASGIVSCNQRAKAEHAKANSEKWRYMEAHKCKRTGYVGNYPTSIYTCEEGQVYTWEHMPRLP
jgi:hypothetical protein